ncbi:hypothetical protein HL666_09115 [Bradyrhizobium sp. 83002]|uniref:hypothetical protein n=1 Tax=Bradyrhizobium aeschynomenes TaxID=2734909 RepID=UPI001555D122|nr:hypothetical protein [Bradyrhizobium aeschynomenes]NPU10920.1 hypothetical protein [Bradyrhizobium aeschynomenes]
METKIEYAAMRQIHVAIECYRQQHWECAITLAAAAEGMLPNTDEPHFRQRVKEFAGRAPEMEGFTNDPNAVINWLKHGNVDGERREIVAINNSEPPVIIWRAITKFYALYNFVSPQMLAWQSSMKQALIDSGVEPKRRWIAPRRLNLRGRDATPTSLGAIPG